MKNITVTHVSDEARRDYEARAKRPKKADCPECSIPSFNKKGKGVEAVTGEASIDNGDRKEGGKQC